jgi:hypothetical protein
MGALTFADIMQPGRRFDNFEIGSVLYGKQERQPHNLLHMFPTMVKGQWLLIA